MGFSRGWRGLQICLHLSITMIVQTTGQEVTNVVVIPRLSDTINTEGQHVDRLKFSCQFDVTGDDANTKFTISWKVGDNQPIKRNPEYKQDLEATDLTEDDLGKLRIVITCSVDLGGEQGQDPDNQDLSGTTSPPFYVGIMVSATSAIVNRGKEINFTLQSTVPFGCYPTDTVCSIEIEMLNPNGDQCFSAIGSSSGSCVYTIHSDQWSQAITFNAKVLDGNTYNVAQTTFDISFKTRAHLGHPIWSNYIIIPPGLLMISLTNADYTQQLQGRKCEANNDPHMMTFDGRRYEHQFSGEYILYKHKDHPFQVNIKTKACQSPDSNSSPFCICGASVVAGTHSFIMDLCSDKKQICQPQSQSVLSVVEVNERSYEVTFPTGTSVEIGPIFNSNWFNVRVIPSIADFSESEIKTEGLCGNFDGEINNDMMLSDGSLSTQGVSTGHWYQYFPIDFSQSWKAVDSKSLFDLPYIETRPQYTVKTQTCTCGANPGDPITCSDRTSTLQCAATSDTPGCVNFAQGQNSNRKKRELYKHSDQIFRKKRATFTESDATANCNTLFDSSNTVKVCKELLNGEITDLYIQWAKDICIQDILLLDDESFKSIAVDIVRSNCLTEARRNINYHQPSGGEPSVLQQVLATCPADCRGKGDCSNGICYCNSGYGGPDCSGDLSDPPVLYEPLHSNRNQRDCKRIQVMGSTFYNVETLTCRIQLFKYKYRTKQMVGDKEYRPATFRSPFNVECDVAGISDPGINPSYTGTWKYGFSIAVSNNDQDYSDTIDVIVFDIKKPLNLYKCKKLKAEKQCNI